MPERTNECACMNETRSSLTIPTRAELEEASRRGVRLSSASIRATRAQAATKPVQVVAHKASPIAVAVPRVSTKPQAKPVDAELQQLRQRLAKLEAKVKASK